MHSTELYICTCTIILHVEAQLALCTVHIVGFTVTVGGQVSPPLAPVDVHLDPLTQSAHASYIHMFICMYSTNCTYISCEFNGWNNNDLYQSVSKTACMYIIGG